MIKFVASNSPSSDVPTVPAAANSNRRPDIAAVIAGVIAVVALVIWVLSWLLPSPQDEPAQAARDDKAQAALATQSPPVPRDPPPTPQTPAPSSPAVPPAPATSPFGAAPPAPPVQAQPRLAPQPQAPAPRAAPPEKAAPKKVESPPGPATRPHAEVAANAVPKPAPPRPPAASGTAASDAAATALLGRWVGTYSGASESGGFTLELTGVSGGVISGQATLGGQSCRGRYPLVGTYKGEKLQMRAPNKGGPAGDCPLSFTLAPEGRWLMGATDSGDKIRVKQ